MVMRRIVTETTPVERWTKVLAEIRSPQSDLTNRTGGDSLICMAMLRNGARIGTILIMAERQSIRLALHWGVSVLPEGEAGVLGRVTAVQHLAILIRRMIILMALGSASFAPQDRADEERMRCQVFG